MPEVKRFTMPTAVIGDIVLWKLDPQNRDDKPCPAIVVEAGRKSIGLKVFSTLHGADKVYLGVRHIDDPELLNHEANLDNGAWFHKPAAAYTPPSSQSQQLQPVKK
jgi:hypothetical protein